MAAPATTEDFAHWAQVVTRIREGEESGAADLYAALSEGVCAPLFRAVGTQSIQDRLHEILVIVLEAIRNGELRDPQRLMGFVSTITRRQVAAHVREAVIERRRFPAAGGPEPRTSSDDSPESHAARQQRVANVLRELRRLKARDREILERFYFHEQDAAQICCEMRLSQTQFRLYKSRAIGKCFDRLGPRAQLQLTKPF